MTIIDGNDQVIGPYNKPCCLACKPNPVICECNPCKNPACTCHAPTKGGEKNYFETNKEPPLKWEPVNGGGNGHSFKGKDINSVFVIGEPASEKKCICELLKDPQNEIWPCPIHKQSEPVSESWEHTLHKILEEKASGTFWQLYVPLQSLIVCLLEAARKETEEASKEIIHDRSYKAGQREATDRHIALAEGMKHEVHDNWATTHDRDEERFTPLSKAETAHNAAIEAFISEIRKEV